MGAEISIKHSKHDSSSPTTSDLREAKETVREMVDQSSWEALYRFDPTKDRNDLYAIARMGKKADKQTVPVNGKVTDTVRGWVEGLAMACLDALVVPDRAPREKEFKGKSRTGVEKIS